MGTSIDISEIQRNAKNAAIASDIPYNHSHSQRRIPPPHIQHLARHCASRAEPDFRAWVRFEYRRGVDCVMPLVLRALAFFVLALRTFGHRRHFRHVVIIGICRALCHAELLLQALFLDACGLLVYP